RPDEAGGEGVREETAQYRILLFAARRLLAAEFAEHFYLELGELLGGSEFRHHVSILMRGEWQVPDVARREAQPDDLRHTVPQSFLSHDQHAGPPSDAAIAQILDQGLRYV